MGKGVNAKMCKNAKKSYKKCTLWDAKTKKVPKTIINKNKAWVHQTNLVQGEKVVKMTKKGNVRPSAAALWRRGVRLGSTVCYDGKCKELKLDRNGRPYFG